MTNVTLTQHRPVRRRLPVATLIVAALLCIYWAALFYGTHTKLSPGLLPGHSDKVIHFCSYAGLGVLLMSLRATRGKYGWSSVIGRWLMLAAYGAFDELTQLLVNRTADVKDWLADVSGVAVGLALVTVFFWFVRKPDRADEKNSIAANAIPG